MAGLDIGIPREHWSEVTCTGPTPEPRSGHIAVLHSERYMLIFAGHNGTECVNDLWQLDLSSKTWTRLAEDTQKPAPRCSMAGALDECAGILFVHGGTGADFGRSNMG